MAENALQLENDGQEVAQEDVDQIGTTSGLADDHVLAELLRLAPFDINSYPPKAILPAGFRPPSSGYASSFTVQPSGSANGSIVVNPFRAIIGSRNAASGSLPVGDISTDSPAMACWRDIRSGIYTGSASSLKGTLALSPNSSGNPRWDLVYAVVAPDADGPSVSRRIKDPTTGDETVSSVPEYILTTVTVSVLAGTPGSTPALPTLPADGGGFWNIALAYVAVPTGFSGSSTVTSGQIRSTASITGNTIWCDVGDNTHVDIATGNNDGNANFSAGGNIPWSPSGSNPRPGPWLPPDMRGGKSIIVEIDNESGSSSAWSHGNGAHVDTSVDWRNRFFRVTFASGSTVFGNDPTNAAGVQSVPYGGSVLSAPFLGNSFAADNGISSGFSTIWATISGGYTIALLVNQTTGNLDWYVTGSPGQRVFFWIDASAQFPNY